MSTIVGDVVIAAGKHSAYYRTHPWVIAESMAIIAGAIVAFLGLTRLGFFVEFISLTSVTAFITGSAFFIAVGQVPTLLGISSQYVDNRGASYLVVIHTFQNLNKVKLDAAIGLTGLLMLYLIKYGIGYLAKKFPNHKKLLFFINTLRTIFVILLYTLISWLVNMHHHKNPRFAILGTVPRGFTAAGVPEINENVIKTFASKIPVTVIVLLIEHISIAKSFGRVNNYTIDPSQELLAIGVANLIGPFLGAYPSTGSFSRTAIKAKAGVRTPIAGIFSSIVVLIAIYALTAVFYYIPKATLSAVIIHAVLDLIVPANTVYQFWRVSPLEVIIFLAGVFVTVFTSIEIGVYVTVGASAFLLLWRVAKARGRFLGRVKIHSVVGDHALEKRQEQDSKAAGEIGVRKYPSDFDDDSLSRSIFLPINHDDGSNPNVDVEQPYPGVFIYRFSEGFNYPNASHYTDQLVRTIFAETRRTNPDSYGKKGDRPWNDPGPRKGREHNIDWKKPTLKAVILDFSSVNNIDITSVQNLIDVRNQLDRYAAPEVVEWHFACINNRWTKRGLSSAGFGFPSPAQNEGGFRRWKPIYSVAEIGGETSAAAAAEDKYNKRRASKGDDIEAASPSGEASAFDKELYANDVVPKMAAVHGLNRPFFHIDLTSAFQSAVASIKNREARLAEELPPQADPVQHAA